MNTIIQIIDFIIDHKLGTTIAIGIISAIIALIFLVIKHKEKVLYFIFHRRNRYRFSLVFFIFTGISILAYLKIIISKVLFFNLLGLNILFLCSTIIRIYKPFYFVDKKLKRYNNKIQSGFISESKDFFESKHWYIISKTARISFKKLQIRYYLAIDNNLKVLNCTEEIEEKYLYEEDLNYIFTQKARALIKMGDFSAAKTILELLRKRGKKGDANPFIPIINSMESFFLEQQGNIEKAFEVMNIAKGYLSSIKTDSEVRAQVLNDYARIQVMRDNQHDAYRHYKLAFKEVISQETINVQLLHTIVSNIIFNGSKIAIQECEAYLTQYKTYLDMTSAENILRYYNSEILFYKQTGNAEKTFNAIKKSYNKTISSLSLAEKANLQASTFKTLIESSFSYEWILTEIEISMDSYFNLPNEMKLSVFKIFIDILNPNIHRAIREKFPLNVLFSRIIQYYEEDAIADVDSIIASLNLHEKYKHQDLTQIKLDILKILDADNFIEKQEKVFLDLYKTLYDSGLHIDATKVLLDFIIKCASPAYIYYEGNLLYPPISHQEVLNSSAKTSQPKKTDSVVLNNSHQDFTSRKIIPIYYEKISENLKIIMSEFDKWQAHPFKFELSIFIAYFLMALEREKEAETYYNFYVRSNTSINNYSRWVQDIFQALRHYFES